MIRWIERLFWGTGITLLLVYGAIRVDGEVGRRQGLIAFQNAHASTEVDTSVYENVSEPDTSLWNAKRIKDYQASLAANTPPPRGVLRIPDLKLEVPIYPGTTELVLNRGVGLIDGTARLNKGGNTGLSSHRDGYFRVLKDIEKGDAIVVDSPRGEMTYRVRETFVLDKMDDSVLDPTPEPTVTLVTCYPFYFVGHAPKRFIVRAVLEENSEAPQSTDLAQSAPTAVAEN